MRHHLFAPKADNHFTTAVLMKQYTFDQPRIKQTYCDALAAQGIPLDKQIALTLAYDNAKSVKAAHVKEYSAKLLKTLDKLGVTHIYCTDGTYFKYLAGEKKAEVHLGYVLPVKVPGFEHMSVVYGINYQVLVFAPDKEAMIAQGLTALADHYKGQYTAPGTGIIHSESYPDTVEDIRKALGALHMYPHLAADIEGFSLRLDDCGVGTIAFAWTQHDFIAFKVDLFDLGVAESPGALYSERRDNEERRAVLRDFLRTYKGRLRFHSATFDVKHLIYNLFMADPLDYVGTIDGLDIFNRIDCTKVISYLATNSCAGNTLGLKAQSQEYTGNYAVDEISDIRKIPVPKLLRYNGVDCMATNYVFDKHMPTVIADQQLDLYEGLMLDSVRLIINTELVGLPMCPRKVVETKEKLEKLQLEYLQVIQSDPMVDKLTYLLQVEAMEKKNATLKTKQHPLSHFSDVQFNPGSPLQLQKLLYELMDLPILARTPTKAPATGGKIIKQLLDHDKAQPYKVLLQALVDFSAVTKIIQAFIPAFENGILKADGMRYLHGVFNIGGTVSGRLSSSDPNLQNLPSGSAYGKLVKELFVAPPGWLWCGADFASLEDRISALTTKDRNKLKVYTDGYDGHSLRAYSYFGDQMPDIVDTVEAINSIADKYPQLRQDSKAPTFLLTYGGTHHGMMKNLGWSKSKSIALEERYHVLYKESDDYIRGRLNAAVRDGYVTVAFGLRLRTPLLAQVVSLDLESTPKEAQAEGRTAGNAMGQSYGLLNNRAAAAFMKRVHASPYRYDIKPICMIHDSIYLIVKNDPVIVAWANKALTEEMSWQELPEIMHDTVKLGAEMDVHYQSWAQPITLPCDADVATIKRLCAEGKKKYDDKNLQKVQ